ncbi:MAG: Lrp/AsnC family transcriptional regulator [Candidatus Woesearchaeota archaeon]
MKKSDKFSGNFKIDKKDIEIIKVLEEEGRIPVLELAKRVSLSHETTRYRINKMMKSGVIEKFIVRINKHKLGYNIYAVIMIATWNYTQQDWDAFFKHLMEHKSIVSVEKITGKYDIKIAFWAKDAEDLDSISHSVKTRFSKMIKDWESFIFTKQYKWKELPF